MGRHNKFGTGGTGKHFKTIVKEERLLTFAKLQGEEDFQKKRIKKYMSMDFPTLVKSLTTHLGKMVDRATVDDLVCLATGFLGYEALGDIKGGLIGMVGYKLATTDGTASEVAGLAILTTLGIIGVANIAIPEIEAEFRREILGGLPDLNVSDANQAKKNAQEYIVTIAARFTPWKITYGRLFASIWDFVDWGGIREQYSHALALAEASGGGAR